MKSSLALSLLATIVFSTSAIADDLKTADSVAVTDSQNVTGPQIMSDIELDNVVAGYGVYDLSNWGLAPDYLECIIPTPAGESGFQSSHGNNGGAWVIYNLEC